MDFIRYHFLYRNNLYNWELYLYVFSPKVWFSTSIIVLTDGQMENSVMH